MNYYKCFKQNANRTSASRYNKKIFYSLTPVYHKNMLRIAITLLSLEDLSTYMYMHMLAIIERIKKHKDRIRNCHLDSNIENTYHNSKMLCF